MVASKEVSGLLGAAMSTLNLGQVPQIPNAGTAFSLPPPSLHDWGLLFAWPEKQGTAGPGSLIRTSVSSERRPTRLLPGLPWLPSGTGLPVPSLLGSLQSQPAIGVKLGDIHLHT